MITSGPRRALAAFFCASLLLPPPALAAAVAELSVRTALAPAALPPAALSVLAPAAAAAPAFGVLAAPAQGGAPFAAAPALQAVPASAAGAEPASPSGPAEIPAAGAPAPESRRPPLARARAALRSATMAARALGFLAYSALLPQNPAALPIESYLRENQEYSLSARRAALTDGSVVEASGGAAPYRVSLSHPGLKDLFVRVDAAKAAALDEEKTLAAVRAAVAGSLPRGRDLALRAVERRRARAGRTVELGVYAERGRGADEEAALLANLALQRAGLKPKLVRMRAWRRDGGAIVDEERSANLVHTARGQVLFDPGFAPFDGRRLQDLAAPRGAPGAEAGVVEELDGPRVFSPAGKPKTSGVEAKVSGSKELAFAVTGRSAAERQFKEEEKKFQAASPDEPVTVEWLFFPFYADGHTALRVGDQLFEFGRKGWRTHGARAFLFNNPYFDAQLARHPNAGIPSFSLGAPLSVPKREVDRFVENVRAMQDAGKGWFSFWFNNCNQVPFRFLARAGVALRDGVFTRFSSIRSFREILLHPPAGAGAPRLYPLPNQAAAAEPLGPAVPRVLVEEHSVAWDVAAFLWNWPRVIFWARPGPRAAPPAPKG